MKHIQTGCFAVALLAASSSAWAAKETVLYSFKGGSDGESPAAGLINVGGTLYGTTAEGGFGGRANYCTLGCGTVFSVTPAGAEPVYSFKGGSDGAYPDAGLINVGGTLYGTTSGGGAGGTVFSVTPGPERVVYSFQGGGDGTGPFAGLINVGGTLYGTTNGGGATDSGTVFKVTPAGVETVVYAFKGGSDGAYPYAGLIKLGGTLYGTTQTGGGNGYEGGVGCGIVFSITPAGAETVVYSFKGGSDGAWPVAGLIRVGGTLYGTTWIGGNSANSSEGCGTVFKITTAGAEKVVYSFKGELDGAAPEAGLINVGGTLYGTTNRGGGGTVGYGTVFAVKP